MISVFWLAASLWPGGGLAAENELVTSLTLRQEFNDNIFYDQSDLLEDLITSVMPAIEISRHTNRYETYADARIASRYYRDNHDLNATDQFYHTDLLVGITDRMSVSADAEYARDSRRDRDMETTGMLLTNAVRDRWSFQGSGRYLLSEKSRIQLSAEFHDEAFEEAAYDDYRYWRIGMVFSRHLTPDTSFETQFNYARYQYPDQEVENWSATVGIDRQFTEKVSGYFHLGGRKTAFTYRTYVYEIESSTFQMFLVPVETSTEKDGFVGSLGMNYRGEVTSCTLYGSHDISANSGTTGTTQRTSLGLTFTRQWTQKIFAWMNTRAYCNQTDDTENASSDIDRWTVQLEPGLRYSPVDWLSLSGTYRYTRLEDRGGRSKTENNTVWLVIAVLFDLLN